MKEITKLITNNILLLLILLLFLFSRLYNISEIPASLYWDEASIGYNAYSVLKTGKDEWGEFLPLHFRAFGEFKLPVYIYSVLLAEIVFGVSQLAVRIPAVIFGLFSVLGLYLLVLTISKNKTISLLSSLLFAVSPWFFIFSRTGYEATAGLAFFIYALYFLLLSQTKKWKIILSVILFILSAYSYNSFRLLTLLFLGPYMIFYGLRVIKKKDKNGGLLLLLSAGLLFLSFVPIYKLYLRDAGLGRLQTVGITDNGKSVSLNIISNYLANYSLSFLFSKGDSNPRSQIPGSPQLFPIDAVFILLGLIYIFKNKDRKHLFILIALVLAPIPAAITKEAPHALRSILMAPIFAVVAAMGIYSLLGYVKKYRKLALAVIVFIYLDFFGSYFYQFITRYNGLSSSDWQYPYKEIFANQKSGTVTDEYGQPYIFALFYTKTDPKVFLETKQLNPVADWGFSTVKSFGEFQFIKP